MPTRIRSFDAPPFASDASNADWRLGFAVPAQPEGAPTQKVAAQDTAGAPSAARAGTRNVSVRLSVGVMSSQRPGAAGITPIASEACRDCR